MDGKGPGMHPYKATQISAHILSCSYSGVSEMSLFTLINELNQLDSQQNSECPNTSNLMCMTKADKPFVTQLTVPL